MIKLSSFRMVALGLPLGGKRAFLILWLSGGRIYLLLYSLNREFLDLLTESSFERFINLRYEVSLSVLEQPHIKRASNPAALINSQVLDRLFFALSSFPTGRDHEILE
jgi:hypothetical protein